MQITKFIYIFIFILQAIPCALADIYVQSYSSGSDGTTYSETIYNTDTKNEKEEELKAKEEELKKREQELEEKEQGQQNLFQYPNRIIYQQLYYPSSYPFSPYGYNNHIHSQGGLNININSGENHSLDIKPSYKPHKPPHRHNKDKESETKDYEVFNKKVY